MPKPPTATATALAHGASRLPAVEVASYNLELKDDEGFVGDRASKSAFRKFIDNWRKPLREIGEDPFGDEPSSKIAKKQLNSLLAGGDPEVAGVIQSAINPLRRNWRSYCGAFSSSKAGKMRRAW